MTRRQLIIALLGSVALAGCGRRGPLEPPPYTEQGREWQRRQGRNPDGTPRRAGERPAEGSVQEGLRRDQEARTTVDVEGQLEGETPAEGVARAPSDPTQAGPTAAQTVPGVSPTGSRRRPPGIVPPKQPFILDPLL